MPGAVVVFVVWILAVLAITLLAVLQAPRWQVGASRRLLGERVEAVVAVMTERFGRPLTALLTYLTGFAVIIVLLWPVGILAHALENAVDWPVFRWFQARQLHDWSTIWWQLTNIGKPRLTQAVAGVAAIGFAVVWKLRGRRWWIPLVIFPLSYALEKYCQIIIQDVVHRGHPPTTLGTFPSGGCARVLIIYGMVIFVTISWRWPSSKRAWAAGCGLLAVLWTIQAYARTYNLEHWITDVVGGTLFGLLALLVAFSAFRILSRPSVVTPDGGLRSPSETHDQAEPSRLG